MSNTNAVADAWEDDWETAADVRILPIGREFGRLTSSTEAADPPGRARW
jgi:hypothetical protein